MHVFVVRQLRLSRLVAGALTGAALGLSGCLMQTVARNRLATPGIIGIENGATMFAIASVLGTVTAVMPTAMALIGAVTATALTFALAGGLGTQGYRFIVAGIGVGAALGAVTQLLMARAPIDSANAAWAWTVGSLNAPNTTAVYLLMAGFSLCLPAALLLGRSLTLLRFSDNVARSLGIDVTRCRRQALGLAVVLCGLSVAVAGPVGLIALMGPEIARFLSSRRRVPLVASALAGAILMCLADLTGRILISPIEIPVGLITSVVGGPFLFWILLRPGVALTP